DTLGHAAALWRDNMTAGGWVKAGLAAAAVAAILVLIVASHHTVSLFENGRARLALDAVRHQGMAPLTVVKVAVTPDMLTVTAPDRDSSAPFVWTASRRSLFGWSEWDHVT